MERELDNRLYFRHVLVINLARRTDRLDRFMARFEAAHERYRAAITDATHPEHDLRQHWPTRLNLTVLTAFDGAERAAHLGDLAGRYGCLRSHLAALRQSPSGPYAPLLVFEDDADFGPDLFADLQGTPIPSNWEVLWLGGEHRIPPEHVTVGGEPTGLVRQKAIQRGHAYIVRSPLVIYRRLAPQTGHHDRLLAALPVAQYALWPGRVGQEATTSDISGYERPEPMFWNDVTPTGGPRPASRPTSSDHEEAEERA